MWLSYNTTLANVMLASTHNSLISRAYGYGLEDYVVQKLLEDTLPLSDDTAILQNQVISLTDQLSLGLRYDI